MLQEVLAVVAAVVTTLMIRTAMATAMGMEAEILMGILRTLAVILQTLAEILPIQEEVAEVEIFHLVLYPLFQQELLEQAEHNG